MTKVLNSLYVAGTGTNSQALGITGGYTYISKNLSVGQEIYSSNDRIYIKVDQETNGLRVVNNDNNNIVLISGSSSSYFNDFQTSSNLDSIVVGGTNSQNSFGSIKIGNSRNFLRLVGATSHSAIISATGILFGGTFSQNPSTYPLRIDAWTSSEVNFIFESTIFNMGTASNKNLFSIRRNGDLSLLNNLTLGTSSQNGKLFIFSTSSSSSDLLLNIQSGTFAGPSSSTLRLTTDGNILMSNFRQSGKIEITSTFSNRYSDLVLTTNTGLTSSTYSQNSIIGLTNGIQISPRNNSIKIDPNVKIVSTINDSTYIDFGLSASLGEQKIGMFTNSNSNAAIIINPSFNVPTESNIHYGVHLVSNIISTGPTQTMSSLRIDSNITSTYSNSTASAIDIRTNGTSSLVVFNDGNVSIGGGTSSAKLSIIGGTTSFKLMDGNQGSGKFLISDEYGYGTWTTFSVNASGNATAFGEANYLARFNGLTTLTSSRVYQGLTNGAILIGYTGSLSQYDLDQNSLRVKGDVFFDNYTLTSRKFYLNGSYLFDDSVKSNIALGYTALGGNFNTTNGQFNIAVGYRTLLANTVSSDYNIGMGYESLKDNTGSNNIGIGYHSLWKNTSGTQSIAIGRNALEQGVTSSFNNIAIGYEALLNTNTPTNIGIGNNSLRANTIGSQSIAIGFNSLSLGNPDSNIAIGINSLRSSSSPDNIAIGNNSLSSLTTGGSNSIAIGNFALQSATTLIPGGLTFADNNIAIGNNSLRNNRLGSRNISIGLDSQRVGTFSVDNISIGFESLQNNTSNIGQNVAIGNQSLKLQTTGYYNVGLGFNTLGANTSGNTNIAIGWNALGAGTSGNSNIAIGFQAAINTTNNSNIAIGQNSLFTNATGSQNIAIGRNSLSDNRENRNIGIGFDSLAGLTFGNDNIGIGFNIKNFGVRSDKNLIISGSSSSTLSFDGTVNISNNTLIGINILPASQSSNNTIIGANQDLRNYLVNTASSTVAPPFSPGVSPGGTGGAPGFPLTGMVMISSGDGKRHFVSNNDSIAIGVDAGLNDTWQLGRNIAIGREAMTNMNSTWRNLGATAALGRYNLAIGYRALSVSTASYFNIAIGDFALQNQRFSGAGNPEEYNIAIGYQALQANTTGRQNVAIGFGANAAGNSSTTLGNISIGFGALTTNNPAATSQNTAIGYQALNQNRLGIQNFAMGYNSSFGGTFGSSNIAIGVSSNMYNNGSSNIFIGNESGVPIGNIQATQSNGSLFLANYNFNIGIGQWTHRFTTFYDSRFSVVTPPGEILPVTLQSGNNLAIGYRAFEGTTASFMTLFSGATALPGFTYTVSSSYNVAIGNFALGNNQGLTFTTVASQKVDGVIASYSRFGERIYAKGFNTAVGYNAMNANVTGFRNTAVGGDALAFGSHSTNNIAIGFRAGANLGTIPNYSPSTTTMITGIGAITTNSTYTNTADFNIAIGNLSLHTATAASRNIAIGHSALRTYSTQLGDNVAIGFHTLRDTTTGNNNTAIGSLALAKNTTGTNNIGIGGAAGTEITTGTNNLGIGGNTLGNISTTSNNMALGFNAMNNASSTSTNNIGIGVQALASVSGSFNTVVGVSTAQLVRADSNTVIGFESMYSAWHASISGVNNRSAGNATLGLQTLAAATGSSFNVAIGAEALRFAGEYQRSFISGTDSGAPHFVPVQDVSSTTPLPILRPPTENIAIGYRSMQMPMSGLGFTATDGFGRTIFNQIQPGLTQIYYPQFQVGIGNYTLQYNQGSHSVAIGYQAMANALNSSANVAIGYQAMQNGSYSIANIAIGWRAGQNLGNLPVRNTGATAAIATAESFGYPVSNIAIGYNALTTATSSKENIAIGTSALRVNRGGQTNVAIGGGALSSNTWGIENIAIGQDALRNLAAGVNTSGAVASYNVAVGTRTMQAMVSGYRNYALGYSALSSSIDGQLNVAIGHSTLLLSLSHSNVSIGYQSLPALQLGHNNIAIGAQAAPSLGGGTSAGQVRSQVDQYNTIIGNYAASGLTSGSYNTIISSQAGTAPGIGMTSGDYNIHIGYGITGSIDSNVNNTVIGSRVTIGQGTTNSIILANGSGQQRINVNSLGYLGVGTQSPSAMLTVNKQTGDTNTTLVNFTSDSQGILLPRLTTAQILAISSPADGLTVYNTDQQTINFYRGGVSATWSRVTYTSI